MLLKLTALVRLPDEVAGMPLGENAHGYTDAPAAEELKSTCTISVTAFLNAIAKAAANAK